jgi:hypothetical protein
MEGRYVNRSKDRHINIRINRPVSFSMGGASLPFMH